MPKRKKSVKSLHKKLWKLFSLYIRRRDCLRMTGTLEWGHCITCHKRCYIKECDAGHFITRGRKATLYDENNVWLQCKFCNGPRSGAGPEYFTRLEEEIGRDAVDDLIVKSKQPKQFTITELEEMIADYKHKLEDLEEMEKDQ